MEREQAVLDFFEGDSRLIVGVQRTLEECLTPTDDERQLTLEIFLKSSYSHEGERGMRAELNRGMGERT